MNENKRRKIEVEAFGFNLILLRFPNILHHVLDYIPVWEVTMLLRVSKTMKKRVEEKFHAFKQVPELGGFRKILESREIQKKLYQWLKVHAPNLEKLPYLLERQLCLEDFPLLKRVSLFPDDGSDYPNYVSEIIRRARCLENLEMKLSYDQDKFNLSQSPNKAIVFSNLKKLSIQCPEYDALSDPEAILECCPSLEEFSLTFHTPMMSGLQPSRLPSPSFAKFFDRLHELPNLRSLTIPRRIKNVVDNPQNSIPQLKCLKFDGQSEEFEDEFIEWKEFFRGANSLDYVFMERVSVSAIESLSFAPNLKRLATGWLNGTREINRIFYAAKLSHLRQLKAVLSFERNTPTEEEIEEINQPNLPNLKSLFLICLSLSEFPQFFLNLPALRVLNIKVMKISGSSTAARFRFRFSQELKDSLKVLQIYCSDRCEICIDSIVTAIQECKSLKKVDLGVTSRLKEAILRRELDSRLGKLKRPRVHVFIGERNHFMPLFDKGSDVEKLNSLEEM